MKTFRTTAAALAVMAGLGVSAYSIERATAAPTTSSNPTEMRDFTKLSKDGEAAFRDITLARIAIYNADPKTAKDLVNKADASLARAKTDNTAFMKAAGDLKSVPGPSGSGKAADTAAAGSQTPTAWLPVDGRLTLAEDFAATPEKAKAIKEANEHLAKGDQKAALDRLKLEGVGVNVTTFVVPLDSTIAGVHHAGTLIGEGKYYEANAALKGVEDGLRFDSVDVVGTPKASDASAKGAATQPAPAAAPAPAAPAGTAKP